MGLEKEQGDSGRKDVSCRGSCLTLSQEGRNQALRAEERQRGWVSALSSSGKGQWDSGPDLLQQVHQLMAPGNSEAFKGLPLSTNGFGLQTLSLVQGQSVDEGVRET